MIDAKVNASPNQINMAAYQAKFKPGVHIFKTNSSILIEEEYTWQIIADGGEIVAQSYRTYSTKTMALNSVRMLHDFFRFDFDGNFFDHDGPKVKINKTWR